MVNCSGYGCGQRKLESRMLGRGKLGVPHFLRSLFDICVGGSLELDVHDERSGIRRCCQIAGRKGELDAPDALVAEQLPPSRPGCDVMLGTVVDVVRRIPTGRVLGVMDQNLRPMSTWARGIAATESEVEVDELAIWSVAEQESEWKLAFGRFLLHLEPQESELRNEPVRYAERGVDGAVELQARNGRISGVPCLGSGLNVEGAPARLDCLAVESEVVEVVAKSHQTVSHRGLLCRGVAVIADLGEDGAGVVRRSTRVVTHRILFEDKSDLLMGFIHAEENRDYNIFRFENRETTGDSIILKRRSRDLDAIERGTVLFLLFCKVLRVLVNIAPRIFESTLTGGGYVSFPFIGVKSNPARKLDGEGARR